MTYLVYFETYGCQMNVSDTEIAWSILNSNGYLRSSDINEVRLFLNNIKILLLIIIMI